MGVEPMSLPWKGNVLPLDERSIYSINKFNSLFQSKQDLTKNFYLLNIEFYKISDFR
jgi:hypothetical protein